MKFKVKTGVFSDVDYIFRAKVLKTWTLGPSEAQTRALGFFRFKYKNIKNYKKLDDFDIFCTMLKSVFVLLGGSRGTKTEDSPNFPIRDGNLNEKIDIFEDLAMVSGIDRRYSQLTDMMVHQNAEFDERKYWTYGCNCLVLGKL